MFEIEEFPEKWELSGIESYCLISSIFIIIISYIILLFPPTDAESARYLLSALVQSEAAIIAVIVSLSLLGVQLVASSYSSRVIQVFKSERLFWFLLSYYIAVMVISTWVLMEIKNNYVGAEVAFSYILGIIAFLIIVPYILKVLELINPNILIDKIAANITNETILSFKTPGENEDPIQPIIDIIIASLEKYDESVIIYGLRIIETKMTYLFNTVYLDSKRNVDFVFLHLTAIGKLASNSNDGYAAIKIIETIGRIGLAAEDNELLATSAKAAISLEETGSRAAEKMLPDAASQALACLGEMAEKVLIRSSLNIDSWLLSVSNPNGVMIEEFDLSRAENQNFISKILPSFEKIGKKAIDSRLREVIESEIAIIEKVTVSLIKQNYWQEASKLIEIIEKIGEKSIDLGFGQAQWDAAYSLKNIGIEASKKKNDNLARAAAGSLGTLGEKIAQYFEEITPGYTVDKLNEISATFVSIINHIAEALKDIASCGVKHHIDGSVRISAIDINRIRHKSLKILKFDYQSRYIADQLKEYLEEIIREVQLSSSPELFRETIGVIESFLVSEERKSR